MSVRPLPHGNFHHATPIKNMGGIDPIAWSILLLFLGCVFVIAEVFVPSGGVLGFLAGSSIITAIAMAFYQVGPTAGFTFIAMAIVLLPISIVVAFKLLPHTPLGRTLLLGLPTEEEVSPDDENKDLIGKIGTAKSPMLPSGAVLVDGRTVDALSQGMAIEAGQTVVVVEVKGNRVVVRAVDEGDEVGQQPPDNILLQPLDSLGLDPLDDPLA